MDFSLAKLTQYNKVLVILTCLTDLFSLCHTELCVAKWSISKSLSYRLALSYWVKRSIHKFKVQICILKRGFFAIAQNDSSGVFLLCFASRWVAFFAKDSKWQMFEFFCCGYALQSVWSLRSKWQNPCHTDKSCHIKHSLCHKFCHTERSEVSINSKAYFKFYGFFCCGYALQAAWLLHLNDEAGFFS